MANYTIVLYRTIVLYDSILQYPLQYTVLQTIDYILQTIDYRHYTIDYTVLYSIITVLQYYMIAYYSIHYSRLHYMILYHIFRIFYYSIYIYIYYLYCIIYYLLGSHFLWHPTQFLEFHPRSPRFRPEASQKKNNKSQYMQGNLPQP